MGKANNKPQLIEQVAKIASETAVQAALEFLEQERQKENQAKRDRRLRNTKLLLRNYRSFKLHCADIKLDLKEPDELSVIEELNTNELAVESIKRSKERTLAMVRFIDQMLAIYKQICDSSGKTEDLRRYRSTYLMYIADQKMSAQEVARGQNIDERTVYKDVNKACKSLSTLMFGVDGVRMVD